MGFSRGTFLFRSGGLVLGNYISLDKLGQGETGVGPADIGDDDLREAAKADEKVREYTEGKEFVKIVVVPKSLTITFTLALPIAYWNAYWAASDMPIAPTQIANQGVTGAVYGIAYRKQDKRIFSGAFAKRLDQAVEVEQLPDRVGGKVVRSDVTERAAKAARACERVARA